MKILVTGCAGLIGSAAVELFDGLGFTIVGLDNNGRQEYFGPEGSTIWNLTKLHKNCKNFTSMKLDICNKEGIDYLFSKNKFDVICHFAAAPAHDYSFRNPYRDFQVNTIGTVNLLEATRLYNPDALFIFTSTSKVYGVNVNDYAMVEKETRYSYFNSFMIGVRESCSID